MSRKNIAVFCAVMALAGCQQPTDPRAEHLARENDSTIVDPPGRYQMAPIRNGTEVYILDTRTGRLWYCTTPVGQMKPVCGLAESAGS